MNRLTLVGRLTRDPELRTTPAGKSVCNMRLAVDGLGSDDTLFIDVATFDRQAEACATYLAQGRQVSFDGRLVYRQWQADDGTRRHTYSGIGRIGFLSQPVQAAGEQDHPDSVVDEATAERHEDDDIPF